MGVGNYETHISLFVRYLPHLRSVPTSLTFGIYLTYVRFSKGEIVLGYRLEKEDDNDETQDKASKRGD